jgi:hypothetical protein
LNTFIRVNGELRKYSVETACRNEAIASVNAALAAERFTKPGTFNSIALVLIEGIGGE